MCEFCYIILYMAFRILKIPQEKEIEQQFLKDQSLEHNENNALLLLQWKRPNVIGQLAQFQSLQTREFFTEKQHYSVQHAICTG